MLILRPELSSDEHDPAPVRPPWGPGPLPGRALRAARPRPPAAAGLPLERADGPSLRAHHPLAAPGAGAGAPDLPELLVAVRPDRPGVRPAGREAGGTELQRRVADLRRAGPGVRGAPGGRPEGRPGVLQAAHLGLLSRRGGGRRALGRPAGEPDRGEPASLRLRRVRRGGAAGAALPQSWAELPNRSRLVEEGLSGPLESTLPPITVPAWSSMMTGRDPGELGVYGFKNRRSYDYGDLLFATSWMVRFPRVWDFVGQAGGQSIVIGVPQTSPPPAIQGVLISGFEAEGADLADGAAFARPPEIAAEIREVVGDYVFDVDDFRNVPRETVIAKAWRMTEQRYRLMEHLLATRPWDFAMLCEIAPDRLHHCFWSDHDPAHRRHDPASPHRNVIRDYYRYVDGWIGRLRERLPADTIFLVVSDHGARAMEGGVCVNEVLRQAGWLTLKEEPAEPMPLRPQQVDWSRTRAWGEGGYYARIFLNLAGREPQGTIPPDRKDEARRE